MITPHPLRACNCRVVIVAYDMVVGGLVRPAPRVAGASAHRQPDGQVSSMHTAISPLVHCIFMLSYYLLHGCICMCATPWNSQTCAVMVTLVSGTFVIQTYIVYVAI